MRANSAVPPKTLPRRVGQGEADQHLADVELAAEHQHEGFEASRYDVREAADADQVRHHRDDQELGAFRTGDQPDQGRHEEARRDGAEQHFPPAMIEGVAADLEHAGPDLVGHGRREAAEGCGDQRAGDVGAEHESPDLQQPQEMGPGRTAENRKHEGDGALGEELLARQDHHQEADRIAEADHQRTPGRIRQVQHEYCLGEQGEADRQAGCEARPEH